jgi:hypothetical protein
MESPRELPPLESDKEEGIDEGLVALLHEGSYLDAGQDGVVLKLSKDDLSPGALDFLAKKKVPIGEGQALKILKIYDRERAEAEFMYHERAWQIVQKLRTQHPEAKLALIPKPHFLADEEIGEKESQYLNSMGAHLKDRAGMIFMDYIPGEDLLARMCKFVVSQKEGSLSAEEVAALSPDAAKMEASRLLQVSAELSSGGTTLDRSAAWREALLRSLVTFIGHHQEEFSASLPSDALTRLRNTLTGLHREKVYHNDLHERNVMVTSSDVFVIDFGRSDDQPFSREFAKDAVGMDDSWITEELLSKMLPESKQTESDNMRTRLRTMSEQVLERGLHRPLLERLRQAGRAGLEYEWNNAVAMGKLEELTAKMLGVVADDASPKESREQFREFLSEQPTDPRMKKVNMAVRKIAEAAAKEAGGAM